MPKPLVLHFPYGRLIKSLSGGKDHHIVIESFDRYSCSCDGFKYQHGCWAMTFVLEKLLLGVRAADDNDSERSAL